MLTKFNSPFKLLGGYFKDGEAKSTYATSKKEYSLMVIGLQTLVQLSEENSNVVIKSAMRKSNLIPATTTIESSYLKSCFLCNKNLSLHEDIYMYRGDQGFCSIECRNRQIFLDEMKEVEASTEKMRKSYRHCSSFGGHETRLLLEVLRRRHKPVSHQNHWAIS